MYRELSLTALWLASASCGLASCSKPLNRTSPSASDPAPTPSATMALPSKPTPGACALTLGADREATRDELLGLLLPAFRAGSDRLPVAHPKPTPDRPDVTSVFLIQPCRGDALESLSPAQIGQLQRLPLGDGRELVQFPVGTKAGIEAYTLGVLAILGREANTLRVLSISEAAADLPGGLVPFQRARIGDADVLLRSEATSAASEDYERGNYVSIDYLKDNELRLIGIIWERRASDDTFWHGAYDWQMTSPGVEPTSAGYLVHEHWSFMHRKTHHLSSRDVLRQYSVVDHRLATSPPDNFDAWPETRLP